MKIYFTKKPQNKTKGPKKKEKKVSIGESRSRDHRSIE